ncbi:TPA: tail fiber assembly protein [Citrobacter freundii]|nr:tail fiber assembly protein [Citrobacter freundii]HCU2475736.1 tail fiber assembly protein [Citrobacter freundii]
MKVYFAASIPAFIPAQWKEDGTYDDDTWPADAVLLSDEENELYWKQNPPAGKQLGAENGRPVWTDIPAPTKEELILTAENERQRLLKHADAVMLDWRTELMLGEISDANKAKLSAWLAYKNEVKSADVTTDPESVAWPEIPA